LSYLRRGGASGLPMVVFRPPRGVKFTEDEHHSGRMAEEQIVEDFVDSVLVEDAEIAGTREDTFQCFSSMQDFSARIRG